MKPRAENKIFCTNATINIRGRLLSLDRPRIMGVLNVTPDSFYDGGRYDSEEAILTQSERMLKDGATFIDVGGYSSRPGADDVSVDEEIRRITAAITLIVKNFPEAIISVDTFRAEVARIGVEQGASLINDISGGSLDPKMHEVVAHLKVPYILMHMRGDPKTMTGLANYDHLLKDITDYFHQTIDRLHRAGVYDIIVDPGLGFAKSIKQNFELLNSLEYLKILNKPIMVGVSRKSMIWKTLAISPDEALNGTTCLNTVALMKGANILRVHDVREASEVCRLISSLLESH